MDPKLKPGSRFCKCTVCGEYFTGESAFDAHRVGEYPDRRCLPPLTMRQVGLFTVARGNWEYWGGRRVKERV